MGAEARRRVEAHFEWEAIARQTLDYYEELREARFNRKKLLRGVNDELLCFKGCAGHLSSSDWVRI